MLALCVPAPLRENPAASFGPLRPVTLAARGERVELQPGVVKAQRLARVLQTPVCSYAGG